MKRKITAAEVTKRTSQELQVQEYIDRYYPETGTVEIEVSPCGTFASVRKPSDKP